MREFVQHVGSRIRLYRHTKKMTLEVLAQKIHKSKTTLAKYETGDITLDIETLYEIAQALEVRVQQLLDFAPQAAQQPIRQKQALFPQRLIHVYFYDGRVKKIVRSLLEVDAEESSATLYYDIPSFSDWQACRSLYFGVVTYFDTVTNFSFQNQNSPIEHTTLCVFNPFDRTDYAIGMLSGISRYPMLPVSLKCILSPTVLEETEDLTAMLVLSKKDLKLIKTLNMFAVET